MIFPYAIIGMRYHSNIFSAKAGTPFISISYEQKMAGFMNKMNLEKYCICTAGRALQCGGKGTGAGRIFLYNHIGKDERKRSNRVV